MSETPKQYTLDDVTQMTYEEFSKTDQNLLPVELDPTNLETKKDFEDMQKWIGFYSACSETETKPKESFARNLITQTGSSYIWAGLFTGPALVGHEVLHGLGGKIAGCNFSGIGVDLSTLTFYAEVGTHNIPTALATGAMPYLVLGSAGMVILKDSIEEQSLFKLGLGSALVGAGLPIGFWLAGSDMYQIGEYISPENPIAIGALIASGLILTNYAIYKTAWKLKSKVKDWRNTKL